MGRRKSVRIDLPGVQSDQPSDCPPNCTDPGTVDNPTNAGVKTSSLSRETIVYHTDSDSYEKIKDCNNARMGHFYGSNDDFIYVFGGYAGNGNAKNPLLTSCERLNVGLQTWERTADMPTPRAFGMSTKSNSKIYCIGGIELDPISNQFTVSGRIEVYDTLTATWDSSLASMPDGYEVAYGNAQIIGDYIYVVCGFSEMDSSSQPTLLNNKVLRYSIPDNEWILITPSDQNLYNRISPFAFARSNEYYNTYYVVGGSIPKSSSDYTSELEEKTAFLLKEFRAFVQGSDFVSTMNPDDQSTYIADQEELIRSTTRVTAFVYPMTSYKFEIGSEVFDGESWTIDISDTLDDEWRIIPAARDDGRSVYISTQDKVYFLGGSNQNTSVTLSTVESIALDDGIYTSLSSMDRGRIRFAAVAWNDDIYILGGQTSGHREGYVQVNIQQFPGTVKAIGTQSNGFLITLTDDTGQLIPGDIRLSVRGHVRISEVDKQLTSFLASRAVDRIRSQLPNISQSSLQNLTQAELDALIAQAQSLVTNPNSDEFQINSARKLNEQVFLFPVLYSETDVTISNGVGGFILKPRSEDPLADIKKLSEFIRQMLANTLPDENQKFAGDLTREELASLGDTLAGIALPTVVIESGAQRTLYDIETTATVVDDFYFGSTVSDYDEQNNSVIRSKIEKLLQDLSNADENSTGTSAFTRYSLSDDIFGYKTQDGQSTSSLSKIPLALSFRDQLPSIRTTFYNNIDWIPSVNKHVIGGLSIDDALSVLDVLDHQIPFGGSQLYDAITEASTQCSGEIFDNIKKSIYIGSDNSENLSITTRDESIDEINSIDGEGKTPVIYTVFSTSKPITIASQLERTDKSDIDRIAQSTNGQSTTLVDSSFISQILNFAIGGAAGGMGYGLYRRVLSFDDLTAITNISLTYFLPDNTISTMRYRYSSDGFNYHDWSERYEGGTDSGGDVYVRNLDVVDFFAKSIEFEIALSTGFTTGTDDDVTPTGSPRLDSIVLDSSEEKQDFIFLNSRNVDTNVQQVAVAVDGYMPDNALVEVGVATSDSNNWSDFQSAARPALRGYGKTFLLERSHDDNSIVQDEVLSSMDGLLWTTKYGPWDPGATATLSVVENDVSTIIYTGFVLYPRQGQVYFDTKQPLSRTFRLNVVNDNIIRVGLRLRNRLHNDSLTVSGVGYMYSTNDDKPNDLVELAPIADHLFVTPVSPNASDTFIASYNYIDPNNDREEGSIINWFKNGQQLTELTSKLSWTNDNLNYSNRLQVGDSITFSVRPSDGIDYGIEVFSKPVIIQSSAPSVQRPIRIVPYKNNSPSGRYDTASTLVLQYVYLTDDIGPLSLESGTTINWYISGDLAKSGTYSSTDSTTSSILQLIPTDWPSNLYSHRINATVQVEITPRNASGFSGETIASGIVTIVNNIPSIVGGKISITPSSPIHGSTDLLLIEPEVADIDVTNGEQSSTTIEIEWYRSSDGITYEKVSVSGTGRVVDKSVLKLGERWYAKVRPYDYLDYGNWIQSNVVQIR